jgi:minor histocompatibility antigen H13
LFPLAVLPSFLYAVSDSAKPALLTDILGVSFSFNAISLVQLDSFLTGSVVLGGLFVYDVWWVFGTEVVSASAYLYTRNGPLTFTYAGFA